MTDVLVRLTTPSSGAVASGWVPAGEVAAVGHLECRPYAPGADGARLHLEAPDRLLLPASMPPVRLVAGEATLHLAPTGAGWCWQIIERTPRGKTRYVLVPDSAATLDYAPLVDVDPTTLAASAEPEAAWWAAVDGIGGDIGQAVADYLTANPPAVGGLDTLPADAVGYLANDGAGTLTWEAVPSGSLDTEGVQDVVGAMVTAAGGTYNDAAGTITLPGGSSSTITADDTPAVPAEGESASYLVTSAVSWPAGLVWSTDPDGGVPPTITGTALVSLFTVGGTTRAIMGATFPASVVPDTTAPTVPAGLSATATGPTTVDLSWSASTDAVAVTGYEYRVGGGAAVDAGAGLTETVTGLTASTLYSFTVRAYDAAGNRSAWSTAATATTAAAGDTTAPTWNATFTLGTPTETAVVATASALASDNSGSVTYEVSYNNAATWSAIVPSGSNFTLAGSPGVTYATTKLRAKDAAGNYSTPVLSVPSYTMAASADVTNPTVGTMAASSITPSGFTLTVSGASDAGGLHAQPYAFDTGSGYSDYQASPVYVVTGKTASTGYSCNWRVRDAAGNISTGTAQLITTTVAGTLTYRGYSASGAETLSYTYKAAPLGAESPTREVIVVVAFWSSGSRTTDSVAIGGVAASRDYYASTLSAATSFQVWRATVPVGTAADVVVGVGGGTNPAAVSIAVWTTDGPVTFLGGSSTDLTSGGTSVTVTNNLAVNGGFAVAAQRSRSNAFATTFTGLTERYDTAGAQPSSGGDTSTTGPVTVTATLSPACTLPVRLGVAAYRWGA